MHACIGTYPIFRGHHQYSEVCHFCAVVPHSKEYILSRGIHEGDTQITTITTTTTTTTTISTTIFSCCRIGSKVYQAGSDNLIQQQQQQQQQQQENTVNDKQA